MKVLWVKSGFLHPTTTGGQIRTLEIVKHLHRWHEVHYAALTLPRAVEGPRRASEYSTKSYAFPHEVASKRSMAFAVDLAWGVLSPTPLVLNRFYSPALARFLPDLIRRERFDRVVCDFLSSTPNIPDLKRVVLFQHNVETVIWRRRVEHTVNPLVKMYLRLQADRMFQYEQSACRTAGSIVAVSPDDANTMRDLFGVSGVHAIPTGVDVEYFAPRGAVSPTADMVFCGSMDWPPNADGVDLFLEEILPRIRRQRPETTLVIVGRKPSPQLQAAAKRIHGVTVTGTVPDVRPHLWGARISIVPLRIGGGTRLKIYESMAARVPVVSTTIGAEGLEVNHPENIRLADEPERFAAQCLELLESDGERRRMAEAAWQLVSTRFTSEQVARRFEEILKKGPIAIPSF